MIATLGETTGVHALKYMRDKMLNNSEGNEILKYPIQFIFNYIYNPYEIMYIFFLGYNHELTVL